MIEDAMKEQAVEACPYQLWTQARFWCDYEFDVANAYELTIHSLFPRDWGGESQETRPNVELIPETDAPRGVGATSARTQGRTISYLEGEVSPAWTGMIRRVVASGFIPHFEPHSGLRVRRLGWNRVHRERADRSRQAERSAAYQRAARRPVRDDAVVIDCAGGDGGRAHRRVAEVRTRGRIWWAFRDATWRSITRTSETPRRGAHRRRAGRQADTADAAGAFFP